MIVDLREGRNDTRPWLYKTPSVQQMLMDKGGVGRSNVLRLQDIASCDFDSLVVDGDLENMLSLQGANLRESGQKVGTPKLEMAGRILEASQDENKLVILSSDYRIGGSNSGRDSSGSNSGGVGSEKISAFRQSAQYVISHSETSLVRINTKRMKRELFGNKYSGGGEFTQEEIIANNITTGRVLRAVMGLVHDNPNPDRILSGYSWQRPARNSGKNIVSLSRAIQGLEKVMLSNMTFWQRRLATMPNSDEKERYERHRDSYVDCEVLVRMPLDSKDYIRLGCEPNKDGSGWHMNVSNRAGKRDEDGNLIVHQIDLMNLPCYKVGTNENAALRNVWNLSAIDRASASEQGFRQGRRGNRGQSASLDCYFTASSIAAMHIAHRMYKATNNGYGGSKRYKEGFRMHDLPIVIARKPMMDVWHTLRNRTAMVDYTQSNEVVLRKLNLTEVEDCLWKQVMTNNYETLFTTNPMELNKADARSVVQVKYAA
jgi:hypothetical protein